MSRGRTVRGDRTGIRNGDLTLRPVTAEDTESNEPETNPRGNRMAGSGLMREDLTRSRTLGIGAAVGLEGWIRTQDPIQELGTQK